jgi:uncharacterized protein
LKLVLDTNVVIDWLVFADPYMKPLRDGVSDRRVEIITHTPAIEELRRVLAYPALKLAPTRQAEVLEQYEARTRSADSGPELPLPASFPRCKDPDDNHFLALAYHCKADALVSRDNALLKLKRRASPFGFQILDVQQMIAALQAR